MCVYLHEVQPCPHMKTAYSYWKGMSVKMCVLLSWGATISAYEYSICVLEKMSIKMYDLFSQGANISVCDLVTGEDEYKNVCCFVLMCKHFCSDTAYSYWKEMNIKVCIQLLMRCNHICNEYCLQLREKGIIHQIPFTSSSISTFALCLIVTCKKDLRDVTVVRGSAVLQIVTSHNHFLISVIPQHLFPIFILSLSLYLLVCGHATLFLVLQ